MTNEQKKLNLLRKIIKEELLKEDMPSGQSTPVQVGKYVVTVGLSTGIIYVYNQHMTTQLCRFNTNDLKLLLKMSVRKNTDE